MWFPVIAFVLSFFGILFLKKLAPQLKLVAIPNERSLHQKVTPQGGGVIIAIIFLAFTIFLYLSDRLIEADFFTMFGGCLLMSVTGFIDDIMEINARFRFLIQFIAAGWGLYWIGGVPWVASFDSVPGLYALANSITVVALVWFINSFNFMDGIDGLATSGATFFSLSIGGYFVWNGIEPYGSILTVLAASSLAFLWFFNWPPAKMFLGDAGSNFFGYIFGVLLLITVKNEIISIWTWFIILAYFITDTTTTTTLRFCLVKKWYGTHRSHAYQNLARILNNHKFVTCLILSIDVFYLLPLAFLSIRFPQYAWIAFIASIFPIFLFVLKYGPLYAR